MLKAKNAAAVKARLTARTREWDGADLERRCTEARIPAAVVRPLDVFAREAAAAGHLPTMVLEEEETRVVSPGLGFRVSKG